MEKEVVLFEPRSRPIVGFNSSQTPAMLPDGTWAAINDFRLDTGCPVVRGGSSEITGSAIVSGGTTKFAESVQINSATYHMAAVSVSGAIRIMKSTDLTTWTEVTVDGTDAANDKHGNTRMTDSGTWSMTVVPDVQYNGTSRDVLVVQNGVDFPRVYDPDNGDVLTSSKVAVHQPLVSPFSNTSAFAQAGWPAGVPIGVATGATFTATNAGRQSFAYSGANPNAVIRLTTSNTVALNDLSTITNILIGLGRELVLVFDTARTDWLDLYEITIIDDLGLGSTVIWDGRDPEGYNWSIDYIDDRETRAIVGFNAMGFRANSNRLIGFAQFKYVGPIPNPATFTVDLLHVGFSGAIDGGTSLGIAMVNLSSRALSAGMELEMRYQQSWRDVGASGLLLEKTPRIPLRYGLAYDFTVNYQMPSDAGTGLGPSHIAIYGRRANEETFQFIELDALYNYTAGAWVLDGLNTGPLTMNKHKLLERDWASVWELPRGDHVPLPKASCMTWANGRLFVGARTDGSLSSWNTVAISRRNRPFQFNLLDDGSSYGGTRVSLAGEQVKQFAASSGGGRSQVIFCFSDKRLWQFTGYDTNRLNAPVPIEEVGTRSPYSVSAGKGAIFFVDDELRARAFTPAGLVDLSTFEVDDKLQAIPAARRALICGKVFGDRYYLAFSPAGQTTNRNALVYNQLLQSWESEDRFTAPMTAEFMVSTFDTVTTKRRLLVYSSNGKLYEHADNAVAGDLGGAGVAIRLRTSDIHNGYVQSLQVNRVGAMITKVASAELAITTKFRSGGQQETVMPLSSTIADYVWRWDDSESAVIDPEAFGPACYIEIAGTLPAGSEILGLKAEISTTDQTPDII